MINIILGTHQADIFETLASDINEDQIINIQDIIIIIAIILESQ